ncbi:unnamed protein product [Didymodactylos carnosus]|uniref:Uncharacterized protein n=1 Tax=Didymodactylos carnosus TaxID=1234261 RepID=A0A814CN05_9BILA|nr:unnamed protein product [Didymodactylos carnosus]CAF1250391.1 unnamed protein product [Didymodactylos carnosus]CAF3720680.1 unnamed protein product [Didymodactylos carnosus]CAF4057830.1 unnamed protein product [Didymodactylos carnosus]
MEEARKFSVKELVGGSGKKQNWKGLGIAFLVITVICSFIIGAIYLTSKRQIVREKDLLPFTLKDIFEIKLPKPWNGTWISG